MEKSQGLLVVAALLVAGTVAQFDRDNFNRRRDFDRERERERDFFGRREDELPPRFRPDVDLTVTSCRRKAADIFFILDSSSSIYIEDYELQRQFVREIINRMDVSPQATRIGALTYSDNYRVSFGLTDFQNKQDLRNAVNDRNIPYLTGLTNTADAIRYVRTNGQFRPDVTRVIVVITDGYSREPTVTSNEAETARREGFYMFVIGVGQYTDEREWRSIANDPDNSFMYNITNYRALDRLYNTIPNRICVLPPIIINSGSCYVREDADLIFVAGPPEASNAFTSVSNIVNSIRDDRGHLRLSLLLGACKANEVRLTDPSLFCESFGNPNPSLDTYENLLNEMRAEARDARTNRPNANQVAVLFIDQQTWSLDSIGIRRQARDLKYDGIEVYVVDMGVLDDTGLAGIPSNRDGLFSTRSMSMRELENLLLTRSCDSLNERNQRLTPLPPQ